MSLIITNVSKHDDLAGTNDYELRINTTVLVCFKHTRSDGLAACLRAAADAYEADPDEGYERHLLADLGRAAIEGDK